MRLKVHPRWICQTKRETAWEFEWCHYLCFWPLKNSSRPMTSLSRSQLDSPAWLALCWGLFTYFYNGQIRRVHETLPRIPALVWVWKLSQYWTLCLQDESVWLGSKELGQKTASSLFWYRCLFGASHLFAVKVGVVNQYDSSDSV